MSMQTFPTMYDGRELDIVIIGTERWIRGHQIGGALGYLMPGKAIQKIYSRNINEFGVNESMVVELPTEGGRQLTRLYSDKGIAKLAMFASTPKAAAFRDWAATVLTSPREAPPVAEPLLLDTPAPDNRDEIIALQRELIEAQRLLLGRPSREKKINVPWTPEQDARLVELANAAKIDWVRISTQMGRSRMSVASRGHILRVKGLING